MKRAIYRLAIALPFVIFFVLSCAKPGIYPIHVTYIGDVPAKVKGSPVVGVQLFEDRREVKDRRYLGYRLLKEEDQQKDTYVSYPDDVAKTVTASVEDFLSKKGFRIAGVKGWDYRPESLAAYSENMKYIVGGVLEKFSCRARKKPVRTIVTIALKMRVYIGDRRLEKVVTRPVEIEMERTELSFRPSRLEALMSEALTEGIRRTLADLE